MKQTKSNVIVKHASKYFSYSVFAAVASLLMMKYYTFMLTPEQFGILALFLVLFEYTKVLVSFNMDNAMARLYYDYEHAERLEYVSTVFWITTVLALFAIIAALVVMPFVVDYIMPGGHLTYMIVVAMGIGAVYVTFFTRIFVNEYKSSALVKQGILQTILNHSMSFLFMSGFHLGVLGRIMGQGTGYFVNVILMVKILTQEGLLKISAAFNRAMAKETLLLSLPMFFLYVCNVLFLYLDRFFLEYFHGTASVGIYTFGYMLGQGLSMVYSAIYQAIQPQVYDDLTKNYSKGINDLESFSFKYYIGLVILTVVISYASPLLVALFANDNYIEAASAVPFVMVGFMMGGFGKISSLVLGYHKQVWFYPFVAFFAFGSNALLNWFLIPVFGIVGADFASFIGLFLYSSVLQLLSFRYMSNFYRNIISTIYMVVIGGTMTYFYLTQGI